MAGNSLRGQWLGRYQGNTSGIVIVELDVGASYEGIACIYPDDRQFPPLFAPIETVDKATKFDLTAHISPIDVQRAIVTNWEAIKDRYPNVTLQPSLATSWELKDSELHVGGNFPKEPRGQLL